MHKTQERVKFHHNLSPFKKKSQPFQLTSASCSHETEDVVLLKIWRQKT